MADDSDYDLKNFDAKPPSRAARPAQSAPPGKPAATQTDTDTIKNFQLPLWLLVGGVAIDVVAAIINEKSFIGALASVGLGLVGGTALMLVGVLITAKVRGIDLGSFGSAVFKLAAISVAAPALATLAGLALGWIPFLGGLTVATATFFLLFALLGVLFDLEQSDTWYFVCVMFLIALGLHFLMLACGFK